MFRSTAKPRRPITRRDRDNRLKIRSRRFGMESLEPRMMLTGTWTPLSHLAPYSIGNMELLSDGTVMAQGSTGQAGKSWYKLTPDANGSYVNGSWSQLPDMSQERLYFPTNVLPDGRVFVLGGSNTTGAKSDTGEIYNPLTNSWQSIPNYPEATFGRGSSMLLNDGRVLAVWQDGPQTHIYDPATNTWSDGPTKLDLNKGYRDPWTKLPDGSILSYNLWNNPGKAQRYDPATNSWIDSGTPPVALSSASDHLVGSGFLLPDGRVFKTGGTTANTALYTPATTPGGTGTWETGPTLPVAPGEGPGAMMPNGHVLLVEGGFTSVRFSEYDPIANSVTDVPAPSADVAAWQNFGTRMLMLPNGQVLFTYEHNQLYVYTPDGSPNAAWKPTITNVVANGNYYTLTGTQLNGLSAGASYCPGNAMDSNYPIIELKDGSGKVYFARTSNWNIGVATGSTPVSTDFSIPGYMPNGTYSLTVVANGIASDPVNLSINRPFVDTSADLALTYTTAGNIIEGDKITNYTYRFTVTNNGPASATGVVLTDTLGPNLSYSSATKSQGTFTQTGNVVKFTFGSIAAGQSATATVSVSAVTLEEGYLTSTASVVGSVFDADTSNNTVVATTTVAEAPFYVSSPITVSGKKVNNLAVATFSHANGVEPVSAFVATINWGDGTTSTGTISPFRAGYQVKGSHTYASSGNYIVTTTVVESESAPATVSAMALFSSSTVDGNSSSSNSATGGGLAAPLTPGATSGGALPLSANIIDQVLVAATKLRSRRALADSDADGSTDVLDDLFALS